MSFEQPRKEPEFTPVIRTERAAADTRRQQGIYLNAAEYRGVFKGIDFEIFMPPERQGLAGGFRMNINVPIADMDAVTAIQDVLANHAGKDGGLRPDSSIGADGYLIYENSSDEPETPKQPYRRDPRDFIRNIILKEAADLLVGDKT